MTDDGALLDLISSGADWRDCLVPGLWFLLHLVQGKLEVKGRVFTVPFLSDRIYQMGPRAKILAIGVVCYLIGLAPEVQADGLQVADFGRAVWSGLRIAVGAMGVQSLFKAWTERPPAEVVPIVAVHESAPPGPGGAS